MADCIFCKIVAGEIPSAKVYESESVLSFLDIAPINPGHTLVIPKKHYQTLADVPGDELADLMRPVPAIVKAVVAATGAEGYNVFQTNNECAGQVVPHVHFHIIPRYRTDSFSFGWRQGEYAEGEMDRLREEIGAALTI